jgi:replicative DNA helicase
MAMTEIMDARLYIDDTGGATPASLHARIRRLMSKHPLDLVIVDYLQLMTAGQKAENRNQEISSISRGMKLLATEIDAPLIVLSQLSRAPELRKGNARPQLSDLRDSGAIEADANNVHFIYRGEVYDKDKEDLKGKAELIIAKQRSGPTGLVNLTFLHQQIRFENRAQDVDEPSLYQGSNDATNEYTG